VKSALRIANTGFPSDFEFRVSDFSPAPANVSHAAFDDPAVWDMIASGNARAVHHIESPAMTSLCRMCNVREIDGLIAIVSVIRPGAANEQKKVKFTRRYQGLEAPEYPHPSLEACLRSTFGLVVYEEHILQICEAFAGLNPGRADVLRRALVKQKRDVVAGFAAEFAMEARARGHSPEKIQEVWELVTGFNGYAFCKAHSTAYGVEAYQAAWLKRYFPAEFMAGVLTNGKGFYDPLVYVLECHRLGLKLLPPTVNEPGPAFAVVRNPKSEVRSPKEARNSKADEPSAVFGEQQTATDASSRSAGFQTCCIADFQIGRPSANLQPAGLETCDTADLEVCATTCCIRVPATRAKGLPERTVERWLAERQRGEFSSLADFYRRVSPSPEELEILIRLGAFDEFGASRTAQFWEAQQLHRAIGPSAGGQGWLLPPADLKSLPQTTLQEPTRRERLEAENELLGFPASGHPLERYGDIAWDTYCPVARLGEHVGEEVVTCGLVVEQRIHHQITGEPMKFLTLADWTGMVETELFAATYKSYGLATRRYPVLEVTARVEGFENGRGFTLRVLRAGQPRSKAGVIQVDSPNPTPP
jgi:DNA polymerase III alpha subunit